MPDATLRLELRSKYCLSPSKAGLINWQYLDSTTVPVQGTLGLAIVSRFIPNTGFVQFEPLFSEPAGLVELSP